jgi:hypothetical protein
MFPIHRALVGRALRSSSSPVAGVTGGGTAAPPIDPFVNTNPGGVGATVDMDGPVGAESILPKPIRTGAVSDKAAT